VEKIEFFGSVIDAENQIIAQFLEGRKIEENFEQEEDKGWKVEEVSSRRPRFQRFFPLRKDQEEEKE